MERQRPLQVRVEPPQETQPQAGGHGGGQQNGRGCAGGSSAGRPGPAGCGAIGARGTARQVRTIGAVIIDKAVYRNGRRHECGDPRVELARLREEFAAAAEARRTSAAPRTDAPSRPAVTPDLGVDGTVEDDVDPAPTPLGRRPFLWMGLKDPTHEEFASVARELDLHPLAVEDALDTRERPKVDVYEESVVIVLKTLRYIDATSDVETGRMRIFVGRDFVLTVRHGEVAELRGVRAALEAYPSRLRLGPLAAVHGILDRVVDNYVAIDVELAEDLTNLEQQVFAEDSQADVTEIYRLKREVLEFKRAAVPLTPHVQALAETDGPLRVPKKLRPFFSDVADHLERAVEHAEGYDTQLSDLLAAHLSRVSLRQNEDQRKISAWAAIAVFPTLVAGIYGMNFDTMPELHWDWGYYGALGVMGAIGVGLYANFKRSGWL